jgi:exodeoxyribonuclease III
MILEPSHARCSAGRPHLPAGIRHNLAAVLFVTWNVNSLRARLPRLLELLEQYQPDVAALQETKCSPANFPVTELELAGYDAVHHSGGQWAGVALLFRRPLAPDMPLLGLPDDTIPSEARWCEATAAGTRFVSTYVPNGRSLDSPEYPRKLAFLEAAAKRAAAIRMAADSTSLVIAGDMNVAPADADVYDPAVYVGATHASEPERAALAAIEQSGDLVDAYRYVHPDEQQFTWWDYRAGNFHKNLGMRIDLALVSSGLAEGLMACGIDRDFRKGFKPSDHAPLLVWMGLG